MRESGIFNKERLLKTTAVELKKHDSRLVYYKFQIILNFIVESKLRLFDNF